LIEIVVVLAIISAVTAVASFAVTSWVEEQRVKTAARSVADALLLARGEAIRTGHVHVAVFGVNALTNADADIVIVNDGEPDSSDCSIATAEIVHRMRFEKGVTWGTTASLAGTTVAPGDLGIATGNTDAGSSFTTAALDATVPASWVLFEPDGIPRLFTTSGSACSQVGISGQGGGAIYLTNGRRDYAVVLTPLGTVRVHAWNPGSGSWMK
jgi:type II secretory pathway pseudopilin PulG